MAFHNALYYNPDHPWEESLHYRLSCSNYQQKDYPAVIEYLLKLLAEGKSLDDYRVYNLLGNAYFALGQYIEAVSHYKRSLQLAPMGADVQIMQNYYELSQQMSQPL